MEQMLLIDFSKLEELFMKDKIFGMIIFLIVSVLLSSCDYNGYNDNIINTNNIPTISLVMDENAYHATATKTTEPEWAIDFARPYLAAIQDMPPSYSDDFIYQTGWSVGTKTITEEGQTGYIYGEYFVVAAPFNKSTSGQMSGNNPMISGYTNLILVMRTRIIPSPDLKGEQIVNFRQIKYPSGIIEPIYLIIDCDGVLSIQRARGSSQYYKKYSSDKKIDIREGRYNNIILIVDGNKFAVLVNSEPWLYIEETIPEQSYLQNNLEFIIYNFSSEYNLEGRWDSINIWNLN
jgi:hypothetical protein